MSKVICLLGAVGYSGFLHWELWKMQNTNIVTTTPNPSLSSNETTLTTLSGENLNAEQSLKNFDNIQ